MKKCRPAKFNFGKNFPKSRLSDYIIYDQVTGLPVWHSETTKLDKYTGKGGLLVHNDVADKVYQVHYGLVPYKIPSEQPILETADNHNQPDTIAYLVVDTEDTFLRIDGGGRLLV